MKCDFCWKDIEPGEEYYALDDNDTLVYHVGCIDKCCTASDVLNLLVGIKTKQEED